MKKFSYRIDILEQGGGVDSNKDFLNDLGADGWELVSVIIDEVEGSKRRLFFLKKILRSVFLG